MPEFVVPYEVTLRGTVIVDAVDELEARTKAEQSPIWDDDYIQGCDTLNWEVIGGIHSVEDEADLQENFNKHGAPEI
jgi:hypothetical protein